MAHLPGGFGGFHYNARHLEMVAKARIDDARRKAKRGARNVRLGLHKKQEPKPGFFTRLTRRIRPSSIERRLSTGRRKTRASDETPRPLWKRVLRTIVGRRGD